MVSPDAAAVLARKSATGCAQTGGIRVRAGSRGSAGEEISDGVGWQTAEGMLANGVANAYNTRGSLTASAWRPVQRRCLALAGGAFHSLLLWSCAWDEGNVEDRQAR